MRYRSIDGLIGLAAIISSLLGAPAVASDAARPPNAAYGKIELLRDRWGVPHIFSDTDAGAIYGLGYATAEDRPFQIHYQLRIVQGRLAEVVGERPSARRGETAVDHDRKMRTFGFYRAAQQLVGKLDPDTRALLEAYCEGVNDGMASLGESRDPLFGRLGLEPEPWTPADCIASWWHLGQFFATDGTRELMRYRNLDQPESGARTPPGRQAARLAPPQPTAAWVDDAAAVVRRADIADEWLSRVEAFMRDHGLLNAAPADRGEPNPKFSHAWVVGGRKTTTGSAVLVSDPQTPVRNPSIWLEFHVSGRTFNARGVGVPGNPGLLIGWTEHFAWGATALGADQADLFRLHTDADHPNQYRLDGAWRDMEVVRETIKVNGAAPVELTVRQTRFGPLITPFAFATRTDPEVALKRVPVCQTDRETIQGTLGMIRAKDLGSFTRAISQWQFPSLNLVFGSRDGTIGYWLLAAIPVRSRLDAHQGSAAVDGSRSELDWQGYVPHDLLPHVINPAQGWIASGNHRAVGSFYPPVLGLSTGSAGHTVRSWRLYERLAARARFAPQDVLEVHFDTVNPARRDIVRAGFHLRDTLGRTLTPDARQALEHLKAWHEQGARSDLTVSGAELATEVSTFFRFMNTPLAGKYGGGETGLARFLHGLAERLAADPKADLDRDEEDFVDQALAGAWQAAQQRYGADPARWNARARAQVQQRRLGRFETLDGFGSLDAAHDLLTPALACVDGGTIQSQGAQSYTHYVPLHDVDSALSLLPPGQSETLGAASRTSNLELWAQGELHPAPLSRAAVNEIAAHTKTLSRP